MKKFSCVLYIFLTSVTYLNWLFPCLFSYIAVSRFILPRDISDQYMLVEWWMNKQVSERMTRGHSVSFFRFELSCMSCNSDGMGPLICIIRSKMEKEDIKSSKFFSGDPDLSIHGSRNILNASGAFSSQSSIYHLHFPNVRYDWQSWNTYSNIWSKISRGRKSLPWRET